MEAFREMETGADHRPAGTARRACAVPEPHRVLVVAESDVVGCELERELGPATDIEIVRARTRGEARRRLAAGRFHAILLDLPRQPDRDFERIVQGLCRRQPGAAIVVILDVDDADIARRIVASGGQDVLVRGRYDSVELAIALRLSSQRAQAQRALADTVAFLESRNHELEASNVELELFTSAVGHDLRKPIRTAKALADLAMRSTDDPSTADLISRMHAALESVDQRVSGLLRLARVNARAIERCPVGFGTLADAALAELGPELAASGASTRVVGAGKVLMVDPVLFVDLLSNLVTNCVTHRDHARELAITLEASASVHEWMVTVTDNGPGIAPSQRARALQPFGQVGGGPGTGLGLALCHRIVDAHGGRIELEGAPEGGLTVVIHVPRPFVDGIAVGSDTTGSDAVVVDLPR